MTKSTIPNYQVPNDEDSYSQQEEQSRTGANLAGLDSPQPRTSYDQQSRRDGGQQHGYQYKPVPTLNQAPMTNLNNQGSGSSQATFVDVAADSGTAQISKASSHGGPSQLYQQRHNPQLAQAIQTQKMQMPIHGSQSSHHFQNNTAGLAGSGSQPGSYSTNNREPHHLLIENDERSTRLCANLVVTGVSN